MGLFDGARGDLSNRDMAVALAVALGIHAGALLILALGNSNRPTAAPAIDMVAIVPVQVEPALDIDAPALKRGGKRDHLEPPDRSMRPELKPRAEQKAFGGAEPETTGGEAPPLGPHAGPPGPPPDADVAMRVETPITEAVDAAPPANVAIEGQADGIKEGTETDPLKARVVDIYRDKIRIWFSRRFRVSGSGLPAEEITKYRVAATVSLSGGIVAGYTITPSGNAAFDAAARAALEGAKGQEIPPPPENYPDVTQSQISLTFTCTPERCD